MLGKNQKEDHRPTKARRRKPCAKKKVGPITCMQRASASADEDPIRREILAFPAEATLENEQIDKAMAALGISQNLKKEEHVVVARGGGSKSVQTGPGHAARQGLLAVNSTTKVRQFGQPLDLEHVLRHGEGNKNCCSLERVAHDGLELESAGRSQTSVQRFQGNRTRRASFWSMFFCTTKWAPHGKRTLPDARQNKLARRLLAMTRKNWDSEPQLQQIQTKELHPNLESVPIAMGVRMRRLHWAKRMAEQSQKDDPSHQQVLAAIFDQKRLDKNLA